MNSLFPHHINVLGEAMRPVWMHLAHEMDHVPDFKRGKPDDMLATVRRALDQLSRLMNRLTLHGNALMTDVIAHSEISDFEVYRVAGRFEAVLAEGINDYHQLGSLDVAGKDEETRELLMAVYRHTLAEVCQWLEQLVKTLEHPLAEIERRGLKVEDQLNLEINLDFTTSPDLAKLRDWIHRCHDADDTEEAMPTQRIDLLKHVGRYWAASLIVFIIAAQFQSSTLTAIGIGLFVLGAFVLSSMAASSILKFLMF